MILPNVRASFGREEIDTLLRMLEERTGRSRDRLRGELAERGLDSLLDRPETLSALMQGGGVKAVSPRLAFYVMARHALLESGLDDPKIADYVAALLVDFGVGGRAYRIARYDDKSYHYLVDLVGDLGEESSERRQFLLRAHLGNYSLWLSGLFPDYVVARVHRRGAPGLEYYEDLGSAGYRLASECELAERYELTGIFRRFASDFRSVRRALNKVSDRYFFPVSPPPIDRLLRQIIDESGIN